MSDLEIGRELPAELRDARVLDADGNEQRLGERLRGVSLLFFLRHFGCVGCMQQVDALVPLLDDLHRLRVGVVLVGNGAPHFIRGFVARHELGDRSVTVLTDPTLATHRAADLARSLWATLGPRALWAELAAISRGYFSAGRQGDALQQGGVVLLDEHGIVKFAQASASAAEPVPTAAILDAVLRTVGAAVELGARAQPAKGVA